MKLKPILFGTEMVQAILQGRKTQTRRVVKPQPKNVEGCYKRPNNNLFQWTHLPVGVGVGVGNPFICPFGQPSDVLWVRETFCYNEDDGLSSEFSYKADYPKANGWTPSIHMPKAAARIFLEITDVRVEHLHDISEEDAISEGVERMHHGFKKYTPHFTHKAGVIGVCYSNAKSSFESLWKSINGEQSWDENPWVWVVEFKTIDKPQNFK